MPSRFLRACLPGRSSLCVCFVAYTRGGGVIRSAEAPEIGEGNPRKILFLTQRLSKNHKLVYCPEGTIKYTNVNYDKWLVRPRSQLSVTRVRADAHTRTHARKSASHRRPSIAARDRRARPRRWASLAGSSFPDYRVLEGSRSTLARLSRLTFCATLRSISLSSSSSLSLSRRLSLSVDVSAARRCSAKRAVAL